MILNKTTIVIPAYNEADVIHKTLKQIVAVGFDKEYEILVIDDGSDDQTADIIRQFPVKLIKHKFNKGYGAALKTGIRKASGDLIIILDSDGQHDPCYIPDIEQMLDEFDMVIGERSKTSHQVGKRKLGKRLIRWIGEYLVEQKLPDYNSGFRGFRTELIQGMLHLMPNGFSFSTTSTLAHLKEGYNVGTLEIEVGERNGRKSNVKMAQDGSKTILLLFRIIMLF
ncbi:MAG: glycosyltransferase family 2 protein, partial [Methanosarcinaceae archaeon]